MARPKKTLRSSSRTAPVGCLVAAFSLLGLAGCGSSSDNGPIMTVRDVVYNTIAAGDGHAAITIYFSNQPGLCDAESRAERRPGEAVAVAVLEGESSNHAFTAGTYLVQQTDPRVVVTVHTYDTHCMVVPGGDAASSGSVGVGAAPTDGSLPLTASLTFAAQGETLDGQFSGAFCPSLVDGSVAYHCPM